MNPLIRRTFFRVLLSTIAAVAIASAAIVPSSRAADPAAAVAHVKALYVAHAKAFAGKAPSTFSGGKEGEKWFAKDVADRMAKAELGFDPIYDGQDAQIKDLTIHLDPELKVQRGTAHVKASFTNFGEPTELIYLLREENGAWRIIDIEYGSGSTLSQMLDEQG